MPKNTKASEVQLVVTVCACSMLMMLIQTTSTYLEVPHQMVTTVSNNVQRVVNSPYAFTEWYNEYFGDRNELLSEIETLKLENISYQTELNQLRPLLDANAELRQVLGVLNRESEVTYVVAELIASISESGRNEILIDRGTNHGVRAGMAVVDATGVYGQVVEALPLTSRVVLITDQRKEVAVPVRAPRTGLYAILSGSGDWETLELEHTYDEFAITEGDLLVASGIGNVYPAGYPVGVVTSVEGEDTGVKVFVRVQPTADTNRRRWILVVLEGG